VVVAILTSKHLQNTIYWNIIIYFVFLFSFFKILLFSIIILEIVLSNYFYFLYVKSYYDLIDLDFFFLYFKFQS